MSLRMAQRPSQWGLVIRLTICAMRSAAGLTLTATSSTDLTILATARCTSAAALFNVALALQLPLGKGGARVVTFIAFSCMSMKNLRRGPEYCAVAFEPGESSAEAVGPAPAPLSAALPTAVPVLSEVKDCDKNSRLYVRWGTEWQLPGTDNSANTRCSCPPIKCPPRLSPSP